MAAVLEATGKCHHSCRFASFLISNFLHYFSPYTLCTGKELSLL